MSTRIAAIREALDELRQSDWTQEYRNELVDNGLAECAALEADLKAEEEAMIHALVSAAIDCYIKHENIEWQSPPASYLDELRRLLHRRFAVIAHPPKAEPPVDITAVIEAGNALDHKFIDLVAFCAASIPESKLQDLVDDWAGHDERKAWKEATAKHGGA